MVNAWAALRLGFGLARRVRSAVWVLFAANMGLALVAGLPVYYGILHFTSHSLMSEKLLTGFSADWFTDFAFNGHGSLEHDAQFIAVLGLIALPLNAILAGGVLARFHRPQDRFRLGAFFRDCGRYASRMLWLMLFALAAYWAVFHFVHAGLGKMVDHATLYWMDDRTAFLAHAGVGLLVLLTLVFINLVIDFAQVRIVFHEGAGALESFLGAMGFSIARLPRAVAVYTAPALCGIALLGIYRLVTPWHAIDAALGYSARASHEASLVLALLFVGQQLVIFGRYWFRVATWASEWSLYTSRWPPAPAGGETGESKAA
jgi:hypothetical protein